MTSVTWGCRFPARSPAPNLSSVVLVIIEYRLSLLHARVRETQVLLRSKIPSVFAPVALTVGSPMAACDLARWSSVVCAGGGAGCGRRGRIPSSQLGSSSIHAFAAMFTCENGTAPTASAPVVNGYPYAPPTPGGPPAPPGERGQRGASYALRLDWLAVLGST